jgi:spermidine synthase
MNQRNSRISRYLVIAFVEGSAVMVCELLGAKMIAPFYGTSLYVWSSVIGVTLAALATGYFAGGFLADRFTGDRLLFTVLAVGSVAIAAMPMTAPLIMKATVPFGVRTGSLISALGFLLPPLVCMGMISPIIIRLASQDVQHTGRTAGSVYAISTFGGILATFFTGFYAIAAWGVTVPVVVMAAILGMFPFLYFVAGKNFVASLFVSIPMGALVYGVSFPYGDGALVYHSEGILGQVLVVDKRQQFDTDSVDVRYLFVNRFSQTNQDVEGGFSYWPYVHAVSTVASVKPAGSRALILGLGGGSVADEFHRLGFVVDGVELDERIAHAATEYFRLDSKCRIVVDDARHFIRTAWGPYDIVLFDVFTGEQQPAHLLTLESFEELRSMLATDGLVLINFTGFLHGGKGLATRSIMKTLLQARYDVRIVATSGAEDRRNLIIIASPGRIDLSGLTVERQNLCCATIGRIPIPFPTAVPPPNTLLDAYILTDNQPILELLNIDASETWRRIMMDEYGAFFEGRPFFW